MHSAHAQIQSPIFSTPKSAFPASSAITSLPPRGSQAVLHRPTQVQRDLAGPNDLDSSGDSVSCLARGAIVSARASGAAPALGLALGFAAPVDSSLLPLAGPQITPSRVSQQIGLSSPHLGFHYLAEMKRYLLGGGFPSPQPVPKS